MDAVRGRRLVVSSGVGLFFLVGWGGARAFAAAGGGWGRVGETCDVMLLVGRRGYVRHCRPVQVRFRF